MKKRVFCRFITVVALAGWMIVIFTFSGQPAVQSSQVSGSVSNHLIEEISRLFGLDMTQEQLLGLAAAIEYPVRKAAHMAEYAIMGLLSFTFWKSWDVRERKSYIAALALTACYAASDEIHQLFVPGRSGRISDVCIDMVGAAAGLAVLYFALKFVRRHCEKKSHPLQ